MEKYSLLLVQSDNEKFSEIFFLKNPMTVIGSNNKCDIVLDIENKVDPVHAKINSEDINDIGIEDLSANKGILKEKNGIKHFLSKNREYEFSSGRFFYLNNDLKISLLEGSYEELSKQLSEHFGIDNFALYFKTFQYEQKLRDIKQYEQDLIKPLHKESCQTSIEQRNSNNNIFPDLNNLKDMQDLKDLKGSPKASYDEMSLELEDKPEEPLLRIENIEMPKECEGLEVLTKSLENDPISNDINNLLNLKHRSSNTINREDFNNFDFMQPPPQTENNLIVLQDQQPQISQIPYEDNVQDIDINQIDREMKNIDNLEAIEQGILSHRERQHSINSINSINSISDINECFEKKELQERKDRQTNIHHVCEKEKSGHTNAENVCLEKILPNLEDKSDIPVIEEFIKNAEGSLIKNLSQEGEILLEKIEENIEKKSIQELKESIEQKEGSVKNLEIDTHVTPQKEPCVRLQPHEDQDHFFDITIPLSISDKTESIPNISDGEHHNTKENNTLNKTSSLTQGIISDITNLQNTPENASLSVNTSPTKSKVNLKPKLSEKLLGIKRLRISEAELNIPKLSNMVKSVVPEVEAPVRRKRHVNNILPEDSEDEQSNDVSVKNVRTRSGYKNKEISSVNSLQESEEEKSQTTPRGKQIKIPKSKENSTVKKEAKLKTQPLQSANCNTQSQQLKIKVFFIDMDLLDKHLEKSLKNSNCELVDFEEADVFLCNKLSLNLKLLIAVNMHKPILSVKWLEDSIKSKQVKKYDDYYVKDKEFERKYNFKLSKLMTDKPYADYLLGYSFYVTDQVYGKDDIVEIIHEAEGCTYDRWNKLKREDDKSIIIADKDQNREEIKNWKAKGYQVYNLHLILDGVYTQIIELNKIKYKL